MYAIACENVVKEYKNGVRALNGLSISVKSGEIFSLLGENGAGKSTLISILTTFLKCTSGSVSLFEKSANSEPQKIRNEIACVAQNVSVDKHLSLKENMLFQSRLYKIPKGEAIQRMEQLIIAFDLERYTAYPVSSYSGGVKRRLDIALNMMSNPKILFLDEPTVGMDVQSRMAMWEMMKKIRDDFGTTIFLTTHYLEEAEELSDTICIIKDGKEILQGTPLELKRFIGNSTLRIKFLGNAELKTAKQAIKEFYKDKPIRTEQNSIIVDNIGADEDLTAITVFMSKSEIPFIGVEIALPTLQDVFIRLTSGEDWEVKE